MMTKLSGFALTMTLILKRLIRLSMPSRQKKSMLDCKNMSGMVFKLRPRSEKRLRRNMPKKSGREYRMKSV